LARRIPILDRRIRSGYNVTKLDGWDGLTMRGRTIGIIGGGNIGLAVGAMFQRGFDCDIILYDPYISPTLKEAWISTISPGKLVWASDLDRDLYPHSDVVTIHVPLLPTTKGLITASQFRLMKSTAILINTSRGGVVNEDDLFQALNDGAIHGAGIDAFAVEPPTSHAYPGLSQCDRVVMT
jgi:D-3-phosphoglycerate dehydrogenase